MNFRTQQTSSGKVLQELKLNLMEQKFTNLHDPLGKYSDFRNRLIMVYTIAMRASCNDDKAKTDRLISNDVMIRDVIAVAVEPRTFYQKDRTVYSLFAQRMQSVLPAQLVNCGAALRSVNEIALSDVVMASNPGQKLLPSRDFLRYLVSP